MPNAPFRRAYDHRIRERICESQDTGLFPELSIPRSTAASWLRRGSRSVVTSDILIRDDRELEREILRLRKQTRILTAVVRLLLVMLRLLDSRFEGTRLPDGADKSAVHRAIDGAKKTLPLRSVLRILRLSAARYHSWSRAEEQCELSDRSSCPKSRPNQLVPEEVSAIKMMVMAPTK